MASNNPFQDPAVPVIAGAQGITDEDRASLHDIFHGSKNPDELAQALGPLAVPDPVKASLFDLKKKLQPAGALPKITEVLNSMKDMDPATLDLAEAHPTVLKTLVAAATKESEGAETSGKGKPSSKSESAPEVTPASPDSQETAPDVPPTPSGHSLILASDGGLHHVPTENVKKAKTIDPNLSILHVQP